MATLKLQHGRHASNPHTDWLLDVRQVQRLHTWKVEPQTDYRSVDPDNVDAVSPVGALLRHEGPDFLNHTSTTHFGPYSTDDPRAEVWFQLLVVSFNGERQPLSVVCEVGATYLMGDDGGTIDRL